MRCPHADALAHPQAADVDAAEAARPVFLWRACFHVGVANTAALRAAGLLDSDPADDDVGADGRSLVVRDVEGRPTGLLREGACERVMRHLTDNSPEGVAAAIKAGLLAASQAGLTAVQTNCGVSERRAGNWVARSAPALTLRHVAAPGLLGRVLPAG